MGFFDSIGKVLTSPFTAALAPMTYAQAQLGSAAAKQISGGTKNISRGGYAVEPEPTSPGFIPTDTYTPDSLAYRKYMADAMRDPAKMSRWAEAQRGMASIDRASQMGQARNAVTQQMMANQRNMATRGGLSGGALERAGQASTSQLGQLMGQANQGFNRDMLNIGSRDEENRIGMLQTGSGMEMDRARYIQQARENENLRRNAFNANQYNQQMAAWGAGKTADAQKKAAEDAAKK